MTGYMYLVAPCLVCGIEFSSNPDLVPSYDNEPICRTCITYVNENRRAAGRPEWPIHPDAYEPTEAL